jgi:fructose-1-phosphate kinase PfkB-like protein
MTLQSGCLGLVGEAADRQLHRVSMDSNLVDPVSTVGSGDAFLAGYVAARYRGDRPEECLRFAVACGAESVQHFGAGVLDPREVDRLMAEVTVERLSEPAVHVGH